MRNVSVFGAVFLAATVAASKYDRPRTYPRMCVIGLHQDPERFEKVGLPPHRLFEARELDEIVREYAKQHQVDFDFRRTSPQFYVHREREDVMVTGSYSSGIGNPSLSVDIDWHGEVIDLHTGIAIDRVGPLPEREQKQKASDED